MPLKINSVDTPFLKHSIAHLNLSLVRAKNDKNVSELVRGCYWGLKFVKFLLLKIRQR